MFCRYCGKELPEDSIFCPNCGKKQKEKDINNKLFDLSIISKHKKLFYSYVFWFLLHLSLFIFSDKSMAYGFYPFDCSLSNVFLHFPYINLSLFKYCGAYDFSELFFYTILLPVFIMVLIKLKPYMLSILIKLKSSYNRWQIENAKKVKEYQEWKSQLQQTNNMEFTNQKSYNEKQNTIINEKTCSEEEKKDENEIMIIQEETQVDDELDNNSSAKDKIQAMPLFSRFIGSIIDKILILLLFVITSIIISPYGASGKLGKYQGLLSASPNIYEYIDKAEMNRYQSGEYFENIEGVDRYYQERARLTEGIPHLGSTLELDITITLYFILFNLLYYILFEATISASPGKRLLGGIILDTSDNKIGYIKAFTRGLCGGILMSGTYYLIHILGGFSNYFVVIIFFLVLDITVLFSKKSLIDLISGTVYTKVKK